MYAQQPLSQKEQESRLRTVLAMTDPATQERELARFEPSVRIALLGQVLQKEKQALLQRRWLTITLLIACLLIFLGLALISEKFPSFPFYIFFFIFSNTQKKAWQQRQTLLAKFLPEWIKHSPRNELGALLDLAPLVWEQEALKVALRDRLAHLLPRTPTDELGQLTPSQRAGLRHVTRHAIETSRPLSFYEPLAVAGLLAMGSLCDPGVRSAAQGVLNRHTRGHVCAAAEEYLSCL